MNRTQRNQLAEIVKKLGWIDGDEFARSFKEDSNELLLTAIDDAKSAVEEILSEEQEKFDNMPEGLQSSGRGEDMEAAIDTLQQAVDVFETLIDLVNEGPLDYPQDPESLDDWVESCTSTLEEAIDELESL